MAVAGSSWRKIIGAWVPAWAVAVFLPSGAIAALRLSDAGGLTPGAWLQATWQVADAVAPTAKLAIGGLFLILLLGLARRTSWAALPLIGAVGGALVMGVTLAVLPAGLSGGYGIGLTGVRFDPVLGALYLAGGAVAGALGAVLWRRAARAAGADEAGN